MAGSGRARRFRQARELKQGGPLQVCSFCHANLTLGERHDPDCRHFVAEGLDDDEGVLADDAEDW